MAVRELLRYPDARLKQAALPVERFDGDLEALVTDLRETMRAGPAAVGIAAPQIGVMLRLVIIDASGRKDCPHHGEQVLINPEITAWDGTLLGREGCLSVPDYTGNVIRAERIKIEARDITGALQCFAMQGYEARIAQHEIDHLNGTLFIDRVVSRRDLFRRRRDR